jgi:hypothetical protein
LFQSRRTQTKLPSSRTLPASPGDSRGTHHPESHHSLLLYIIIRSKASNRDSPPQLKMVYGQRKLGSNTGWVEMVTVAITLVSVTIGMRLDLPMNSMIIFNTYTGSNNEPANTNNGLLPSATRISQISTSLTITICTSSSRTIGSLRGPRLPTAASNLAGVPPQDSSGPHFPRLHASWDEAIRRDAHCQSSVGHCLSIEEICANASQCWFARRWLPTPLQSAALFS